MTNKLSFMYIKFLALILLIITISATDEEEQYDSFINSNIHTKTTNIRKQHIASYPIQEILNDIYDKYETGDNPPKISQYTDKNGEKHIDIYHKRPILPIPSYTISSSILPPPLPIPSQSIKPIINPSIIQQSDSSQSYGMKQHHQTLIDRLKDESEGRMRRRMRSKRRRRGRRGRRRRRRRRHRYRCDRCHTHRCAPICHVHHQQPLMYAVQSYGLQMAGNPAMPYGVAYAYPVTYHDMKVPVIHGAMMHPTTGMIHPYTAMPHPALFGPEKLMDGAKRTGLERLIPLPPIRS